MEADTHPDKDIMKVVCDLSTVSSAFRELPCCFSSETFKKSRVTAYKFHTFSHLFIFLVSCLCRCHSCSVPPSALRNTTVLPTAALMRRVVRSVPRCCVWRSLSGVRWVPQNDALSACSSHCDDQRTPSDTGLSQRTTTTHTSITINSQV